MTRIKPSEIRQAQRMTFAEKHYAGLLSEAEEDHYQELLADARAEVEAERYEEENR